MVAICGDIAHSRVARSNIHLLTTMGCQVRVIGPPTLIPAEVADIGVTVFHDMTAGLAGVDVVMMLRLQRERMSRGQVPSAREFFRFYGLDGEKLALAKPDAIVMHPGPMNRGVEIDSAIADDPVRSVIKDQVEMGVAVVWRCWTCCRGAIDGMSPDTFFSGVRILGNGVDVLGDLLMRDGLIQDFGPSLGRPDSVTPSRRTGGPLPRTGRHAGLGGRTGFRVP